MCERIHELVKCVHIQHHIFVFCHLPRWQNTFHGVRVTIHMHIMWCRVTIYAFDKFMNLFACFATYWNKVIQPHKLKLLYGGKMWTIHVGKKGNLEKISGTSKNIDGIISLINLKTSWEFLSIGTPLYIRLKVVFRFFYKRNAILFVEVFQPPKISVRLTWCNSMHETNYVQLVYGYWYFRLHCIPREKHHVTPYH